MGLVVSVGAVAVQVVVPMVVRVVMPVVVPIVRLCVACGRAMAVGAMAVGAA